MLFSHLKVCVTSPDKWEFMSLKLCQYRYYMGTCVGQLPCTSIATSRHTFTSGLAIFGGGCQRTENFENCSATFSAAINLVSSSDLENMLKSVKCSKGMLHGVTHIICQLYWSCLAEKIVPNIQDTWAFCELYRIKSQIRLSEKLSLSVTTSLRKNKVLMCALKYHLGFAIFEEP